MNIKKFTHYLILVSLAFLLLVGLIYKIQVNLSSETENVQVDEISLRLKWIDQAQFAGFYVAKGSGLYLEDNLKVTINPGGADISPMQMVISGTDDFGITGADQILLAREKGVPVVALAVLYKKSPVALASLKEKNINSPKDLEGKRVAVVYGKDEEVIYRALLEREKVDRTKIEELPLAFDLSQIISGKADAQIVYEINEPVLLEQRGFQINLLKPRDYGINVYADTLFTTEKMVKEHPELVRKFVKASAAGWKEAVINQDKAIDVVLAINSTLDREHQVRFLELSAPLIQVGGEEIGFSERSKWEELQSFLLNQGLMETSVDVNRAFTNEFLK